MIRHVRRHFICFTMCILTGAVSAAYDCLERHSGIHVL